MVLNNILFTRSFLALKSCHIEELSTLRICIFVLKSCHIEELSTLRICIIRFEELPYRRTLHSPDLYHSFWRVTIKKNSPLFRICIIRSNCWCRTVVRCWGLRIHAIEQETMNDILHYSTLYTDLWISGKCNRWEASSWLWQGCKKHMYAPLTGPQHVSVASATANTAYSWARARKCSF